MISVQLFKQEIVTLPTLLQTQYADRAFFLSKIVGCILHMRLSDLFTIKGILK